MVVAEGTLRVEKIELASGDEEDSLFCMFRVGIPLDELREDRRTVVVTLLGKNRLYLLVEAIVVFSTESEVVRVRLLRSRQLSLVLRAASEEVAGHLAFAFEWRSFGRFGGRQVRREQRARVWIPIAKSVLDSLGGEVRVGNARL